MTATATPVRRSTTPPDVFARTVPLIVERHAFWEHKKTGMAGVNITGQTEEEQARTKALLALTKRLLNSPETSAVRQRDENFRKHLQTVTTPFRPGFYLVPVGLVERVDRDALGWETDRDALADRAAEAYPGHVTAMAERLGSLYNPLDYPTQERFRAAFWVDWRFVDFGVPNILREIKADVFEREREKLARTGAQAREMVEQHLAGSLLKITDHVAALLKPRANGKMPALRDGALDRLLDFLNTVEARNVTDFKGLQTVTTRLKAMAKGLNIELLRDDEELRARTAVAIEEAKAAVDELVTEDTRRAIRLRDDDE